MLDNRWHDRAIDTNVLIQLQDLATTLSQVDLQLELTYGSFIDTRGNRITVSSLWDTTKPSIKTSGYKTDVYLRALGTLHRSDRLSLHSFMSHAENTNLFQFASQLVTLLEDMRLEEMIKQIRPGTTTDFTSRKAYLKHFFSKQLTMNVMRTHALEELFCLIYLLLQADSPEPHFPRANKQQLKMLEFIQPDLYEVFSAKTTKQIVDIVESIVGKIAHIYIDDMQNTYFTFPILNWDDTFREQTLFDELTRTDDVVNKDEAEVDPDDSEYIDETMSTWHIENEHRDRQQTFLQMDLEAGTKTNLSGGTPRETESGDQAFAAAQGVSGNSNQNDYSKLETLEDHHGNRASEQRHAPYGIDNIHAVAIVKEPKTPTIDEQDLYETYVTIIEPYQRKLAQAIEKVLEHKKSTKRGDLLYGRLSKKLLPIVTDEYPRLFYKKDNESSEFDAVFTLMVDCSASMYDKMEETKLGIVLFHEVLTHLNIPHKIVGFWEAATFGFDQEQPNYFHNIHSFSDSLYEHNGAKIMQLEPEEDNRDGFSIRVISEQMMKRHEKHKLLLIFSDGEPSAEGYDQNGIIDTHRAVSDARKQGIDIIGMFLSNGKVDERDDEMMKTIYGNERLIIPDVSELPEQFMPILKKLLLKTM